MPRFDLTSDGQTVHSKQLLKVLYATTDALLRISFLSMCLRSFCYLLKCSRRLPAGLRRLSNLLKGWILSARSQMVVAEVWVNPQQGTALSKPPLGRLSKGWALGEGCSEKEPH
jgi:hypothetical protein